LENKALKFDAKCIGTFRSRIINTIGAHPGAVGKVVRAAVEINLSRSLFSGEREKVRTVSVFEALIQASSNLSHQTKNKVRVFATQKHYLQLHDLNSAKFRIRSSRLAGLLLPWLNSWSGSGTP
jgi:hypothetical protein